MDSWGATEMPLALSFTRAVAFGPNASESARTAGVEAAGMSATVEVAVPRSPRVPAVGQTQLRRLWLSQPHCAMLHQSTALTAAAAQLPELRS